MSTATVPGICRTRGVAADAAGADLTDLLRSKVEQHRLAAAAGLGLGVEVHDDPGSVDLAAGRLVLRPEFSAGAGSAVLSTPGRPAPAGLLAGLRGQGRVLAHRWVDGVPHFANGVVVAGELLLTDCWECSVLEDGNRVRLTSVLNLWPGSAIFGLLAERLQAFVTVAGIAWGPVHLEAVLAADGTVRLVKCAPRAAGEPLSTLCAELGTVDQTAALRAASPADAVRAGRHPSPGYAADYSFHAGRSGRLAAVRDLDGLLARLSYAATLAMPAPGDHVDADAGELPGATLLLRSDDEATIRADIAYYQARNAEGIFLLEAGPGGDT